MRWTVICGFPPVAFCLLAGCRTTKDVLDDYERDIVSGRYEQASAEVSERADGGGADLLMWQLLAGSAKYLADDRAEAIRRFDLAEDAIADNARRGAAAAAAGASFAMVANDRVLPYTGAGQDHIFACLYKAVDYMVDGRTEAARTELNRAAQRQDNWLDDRRREIAAARERLRRDADAYMRKNNAERPGEGAADRALADPGFTGAVKSRCGYDPASSGRLESLSAADYTNAYVLYVRGVFRWINGDGGAADAIAAAAEIKPGNALLRADAAAARAGERPSGAVWVFIEDGLGPCREEWRLDLPFVLIPYLNRFILYAGMALPYLRYRAAGAAAYSVSAGGASAAATELEDVDRLMKTEFDVYMRGALTREITRTVVKAGVQVALGVVAENTDDDNTRIALKCSQLAAAAWAASVTVADLRCWSAAPKKVYAARVPRPRDGRVAVACGG
ncbi:MAG: hypothetical protein J6T01_01695, partial [Kiritimatiellae bacterium]|nr:hypothetical protein [Kiritimatiellia bacterium]